MNDFKLNTQSDNIFLANLSELSYRFDPEMILYNRKSSKYKYDAKKLGKFLKVNPQYGANERGIERLTNTEARYIRITDINSDGTLKDGLGKTAEVIEEQYFLNDNDVLIARSGNTVGKAYLHKKESYNYDCFFAGYMIRFVLNSEIILPDYFIIFTQSSFYNEWVIAIQRTAGQPNINAEEYKSLLIPIPPKEIQQKIVDLYNTAFNQKQQKQNQAKELLASIDTYLLNELGITLPVKDNALENRIFTTSLSQVSGGRLDSSFHSFYNSELLKCINDSNYEFQPINKNTEFVPGYAFSSTDYLQESDCYLITIKNISKNEIKLNNVTYLPNSFFDLFKQYRINEGDLLIAMTGATIGKVGIYNNTSKALLNQRNGIIRPNENLNTQYLLSLLNTTLYQELILKNSVGGAQPNISETDITKIKIPLPPFEKQTEIANHITDIRNQAKALELEAEKIMQEAKAEVETIILGE